MSVIRVFRAKKHYQSTFETKRVLNDFCMDVERGTIYALMGSSGCGKTTLLSSLVGANSLDSGEIEIFGKSANELDKSRIGYMPQETALILAMTIREMIWFFGTIFGMTSDDIDERTYFLAKLLELPDLDRFIKDCSGGQQRRISFALTLIHEPEILILDEPTVGVDPLLRSKIWDYLVELTNTKNVTVLLSTHYVEEAKQSNRVGLMRNGIQIAEDSPRNILETCKSTNLEEAFLKLSVDQELLLKKKIPGSCPSHVMRPSTSYQRPNVTPQNELNTKFEYSNKRIMKALLMKNFTTLIRNPNVIFMTLLLPIVGVLCFHFAARDNFDQIKFGIVNLEVPDSSRCFDKDFNATRVEGFDCSLHKASCEFIKVLGVEYPDMKFFDTFADAKADWGNLSGIITFASNFSDSLVYFNDDAVNNDPTDNGIIKIFIDQYDFQKSIHIKRKMYEKYQEFIQSLLLGCGKVKNALDLPINFEAADGKLDYSFGKSVIPGAILGKFFALASYLTALSTITEKTQGTWNRFIVAGVKSHHFLISFLVEGVFVMLLQFATYFIYTFFFLSAQATVRSMVLIGFLLFWNGLAGLSYGLFISVVAKTVTMAFALAQLFVFPTVLIGGSVWPVQSLPTALQYIASFFPFSYPTTAFRNLLTKNSDICQRDVIIAFIVDTSWIITPLALSFYILRRMK